MFFGGHLGRYSEYVEAGGVSMSATGGGAGLVAGWKKPDGGLYAMGQLDSTTVRCAGQHTVRLLWLREYAKATVLQLLPSVGMAARCPLQVGIPALAMSTSVPITIATTGRIVESTSSKYAWRHDPLIFSIHR